MTMVTISVKGADGIPFSLTSGQPHRTIILCPPDYVFSLSFELEVFPCPSDEKCFLSSFAIHSRLIRGIR